MYGDVLSSMDCSILYAKKEALSNLEYAVRDGVCSCLGRVQDVFCHVVYVRESLLKKMFVIYCGCNWLLFVRGSNEMKQKKKKSSL